MSDLFDEDEEETQDELGLAFTYEPGIFFDDYADLDTSEVGSEGDYVGAGGTVALITGIRIL